MKMFFYRQESGEVIAKLEKKFDEVSKVPIILACFLLLSLNIVIWHLKFKDLGIRTENTMYVLNFRALTLHSPLCYQQVSVPIHVSSTACDIISFNGQGQLCPLTSAE